MIAVLDREVVTMISTLACTYADGVIGSLPLVEDEQVLHEGLAGAFLSFLSEALTVMEDSPCQTTGTPGA